MVSKTLIIYKADSLSAPGWEQRLLMPDNSLTDTLAESIDFSGRLPEVGERVREYQQDAATGSVTHARDGSWVVTKVEQFSSFDTDMRIVLCWCQCQMPVSDWQLVKRGRPVDELLSSEIQA